MVYELTDRFEVASDLDRTWAFFSEPGNLPRITPPWLSFQLVMPEPSRIGQDATLDYTIRWLGIPVKWRTLILDWQPKRRFIDLQVRGPYALWHHEHTFTPSGTGVTCADRVFYRIPGWLVGRAIHALAVRRQLLGIFRYRRKLIGQELGWVRALQADVEVRAVR